MKNLVSLVAAFFLLINVSKATVRTVSNDPLGGSQYNSLQAAFSAAVNGDTLLLEGTNIPYTMGCGWRWNKSLTVIGIGFNPSKDNPRRVLIGSMECDEWDLILNNGGNGSKFYGIQFLWARPWNPNSMVCESNPGNYTFEDCKFDGHFGFNNNTVSNFTFTNCIFDWDNSNCLQLANSAGPVVSNILLQNCVFDGYITGSGNPYISLIIDHCLFLSSATGHFSNLLNATIINSMFMNTFPTGTTNCTYLNNICRVAGTFPPSGNTGSDNIDATDPNLITYTTGQMYSTAHDYHLQGGSTAIGAATDATDIGVYGGTSKFSQYGEVLINPIMRSVIITNPVISPNGTLNVDVHAAKPASN